MRWGIARLAWLVFASVACSGESHPPFAPVVEVDDAAIAPGADAAGADDSDAAATSLRVLFVGNSYTYTNDLPGTLHQLAVAAGGSPTIATSSVTIGGADLNALWSSTTPSAQAEIAKGIFTHVVLQEQSLTPAAVGGASYFSYWATKFTDAAKAARAQPVLFETWARGAGSSDYTTYDIGGTPDGMQDRLLAAYQSTATSTSSWLAPVGEAFRDVWTNHPEIGLYAPDQSHPTVAGTYLAAVVFYDVLAGHAPATTWAPSGVDATAAPVLRDAAARASTKYGR